MLKQILAIALLAGAVTAASGQDTIVYFNGPSFPFPSFEENDGAPLDFDGDGAPDFTFASGYAICTADVPTSGCTLPYYARAEAANGILRRFSQAAILSFGELISSAPPTNSAWSSTDPYAMVADFFFSPRYATSGWGGPLARTAIGYLGVRFYAADGLHYGWIRVRQASSTSGAPIVVDWAYETRTDTPIRAGVIGSGGASRQFTVNFRCADSTPGQPGSTGTFILTGDMLRCELTLMGSFSSADIRGPSSVHAKAKRVASLGPPLPLREFSPSFYTAFFGEVTLTHSQILHLLRGADYVTIDRGVVVGHISPLRYQQKNGRPKLQQ